MIIGYLRVSTDEQAASGLGLDAQRTAIKTAADQRGWQVSWAVDDGYSGGNMSRPALTAARAALKAGEAAGLVVARLDRLSRSAQNFADLMAASKKQGWALVALDLGVDTTTPSGKLVAGVMAQFAEYERDLIGARTREALAAAKARGQRLGRPRATPDAVVAQAVALHAEGRSVRQVARALTANGIPTTRGAATWRPSTVRRLLEGHALDQQARAVLETDESERSHTHATA